MAKKKSKVKAETPADATVPVETKPEPARCAAQVAAEAPPSPPATPGPAAIAPVTAQEYQLVVEKLDTENRHRLEVERINRALLKGLREVDEQKSVVADEKKTLTEMEKRVELLTKELSSAIEMHRTGQGQLPFEQPAAPKKSARPEPTAPNASTAASANVNDVGAAMPLTSLNKYGLTAKKCELVESAVGGSTIGHLEATMRANEWWHREIKGMGGEWINKLLDALISFRKVYPMPEENPPTTSEQSQADAPEAAAPVAPVAEAAPTPVIPTDQETIVIPISITGCAAAVHVEQVGDTSFRASVSADVSGGLHLEKVPEESPTIFQQREPAIEYACRRLAEWFRQRVPEQGEAVAAEIDSFAQRLIQPANDRTDAEEEETEAYIVRIDKAMDTLDRLEEGDPSSGLIAHAKSKGATIYDSISVGRKVSEFNAKGVDELEATVKKLEEEALVSAAEGA